MELDPSPISFIGPALKGLEMSPVKSEFSKLCPQSLRNVLSDEEIFWFFVESKKSS
jgi:hypothetical protein